jgi:hypothetical protein
VIVVSCLVVGACGGGGTNKTATSGATLSPGSVAPSPGAAAATSTTAAKRGSSAPGKPAGAGKPSSPSGGQAAGSAAGGSGDAVPAVPTPVGPGTYRYHQQGTGGQSGSIPPEGTLVVDPARADGSQVWHRDVLAPGQSSTDTVVVFQPSGIYYSSVIFTGNGTAITCTFAAPGVPAPQWPPTVGRGISAHGTCTFNNNTFTATVSGSITGTRQVTLADGTTVSTFVATINTTITGTYLLTPVNAQVNQTDWFSPSLRMIVHEDSKTTFNNQTSELVSDLESSRPG